MKAGPTSDAVLLAHMLDSIERIDAYTGRDRQRFDGSTLVQDGVLRNLHTLTESSQRLSDQVKATEGAVPWRNLAGFRNIVVHGYLGVDLGIVWSIVDLELPPLREALLRMQARLRMPSNP